MKSMFMCLAVLLITQPVMSQTSVSGDQSGTWTSSGSPYLVIGEIVVPTDLSLTIEPGVEVNFQGHYQFIVNGYLQAEGTEADSIFFTTDDQSTGWGGIRIDSDDISDLSYCRIEFGKTSGGYPDAHGGGLALFGSDAVISNCVFADNDATGNDLGMGGAVYASGTGGATEMMTSFTDCLFIRNHCYGEGGAIKFTGDNFTEITRCEFIENDCLYGGGAISFYTVFGTELTNCLFADNYTMYGNGGAMNTLGTGNIVYIINSTLSGNSAVTGDGGALNVAYGNVYFVNSIVYENPGMYSDDVNLDWGGFAEINYCDLAMPSGATGGNNFYLDPQFEDPAGLFFQLKESSPCIDTGIALFILEGDTLVNLSPEQYYGSAPDLGAYEYDPGTGIGELLVDSQTGYGLLQNYPNPFSSSTAVSYLLESDRHVSIEVYDLRGQLIRTLADSDLPSGRGSVIWDGCDSSGQVANTGVYLIRLNAGSVSNSVRVMLLN